MLKYFDWFPRVVRANQEATITIRPLHAHVNFPDDKQMHARVYSCEETGESSLHDGAEPIEMHVEDGAMTLRHVFEGEQEHVVLIFSGEESDRRNRNFFNIYSLEDDLFCRRPYKGDTHIHSFRSDGEEAPAYVVAANRKIGYDFIALTDHRNLSASLEAIAAFDGVDIDLSLFPGEEVHIPDNRIHIVNFGGNFGVNDLFASDPEKCSAEVAEIESNLTDLVPGMERFKSQYASCLWAFEKIREAGGMGVFAHPYWLAGQTYNAPEPMIAQMFQDQPYDAFELIGGAELDSYEFNLLQVARYYEERTKGRAIPVVGGCDSHGCENGRLFSWFYTIAFARSNELTDIIASVKDLYSVAVDALPDTLARAHGPFRLVKYAHFLMKHVFPQHDELCVEEGRLMLAHAGGDPDATAALGRLKGRCKNLYHHLWQV